MTRGTKKIIWSLVLLIAVDGAVGVALAQRYGSVVPCTMLQHDMTEVALERGHDRFGAGLLTDLYLAAHQPLAGQAFCAYSIVKLHTVGLDPFLPPHRSYPKT